MKPPFLDTAIIKAMQRRPDASRVEIRDEVGCTNDDMRAAIERLRWAGKLHWERFELAPSLRVQTDNRGASGAQGAVANALEGGLSNGPISERKSRTPDTAASTNSPTAVPLPTAAAGAKEGAGKARRGKRAVPDRSTSNCTLPGPSNRPGDELLAKIDAYCSRTGTPETFIGRLLFRHDGFVALLRLRGMLTMGKRIAVEQLMAEYPGGLHGVELPPQRLEVPKAKRGRVIKSAGQSDHQIPADELDSRRRQAETARETREPGESIADRFRRLARELDEEAEAAAAEAEAEERRERDLERLQSPSAVLRRAQRDWPAQCRDVAAIAGELGIGLGECWRRVIKAGVDCLRDCEGEAANV